MAIAKRLPPVESGEAVVVEKVLKSNPLLEAFGNAKTIRNDNSSRFGKFTQLQFNSDSCLVGAECRHYLLEKSRVVAQAAGERNYHIFYQLVSAKEPALGFDANTSAKQFRFLQDEVLTLDGMTDLERYQVTRDALTTIGVSDKEQTELFRALCGILRLGQLDFVPLDSNKDDASQAVAFVASSATITDEQIALQKIEMEQCAQLLGVEMAALGAQLCSRTVKARQEVYCVPLSAHQAGNNRDALAKEIYARVFGYLVRRVNHSISNSTAVTPSYLHIDLLDIFGFESFEHNSFEQFCINFANEKLQQKFTMDVFKTVQEEYEQEGVAWEFVKYRDNQDMLDLLENSMGVMALLNEECVRPMGSDLSFVSKLVSLRESHPRLERARLSQMHFLLYHYASPVTYDAKGFVEKNKDSLQTDLLELLGTSSNGLMSMVFGDNDNAASITDADLTIRASTMMEAGRRGTIGRKTSTFMQETVSYKFKAQLSLLMSDISSTEVHYVRCIKPNSQKRPDIYEIDAVVNQLRCAGVVEAIRITRAAFPNKMAHEKFLRRFVMMRSTKTPASVSTTVTEACELLAKELLCSDDFVRKCGNDEQPDTPDFVVGKSLVFFGKDVLEFLEHRRTTFVHDRAVVIQRNARQWIARRRVKKVRTMITKLQARYRCQVQRRAFIEKRKKCVIVQSVWRGVRSRQRMYLLMKGNSAVLIQSAYRKHLAEQKYTKLRNATIKIQCMLKTRKQVDKYHKLLTERKEHDAMETEVDLLKHRLEDEKRARLEIEAENSSLQQELKEVRGSSVLTANSSICEGEALHTLPSSSRSSKLGLESMDDSKLLDDSERMIDYLRKEVTKGRELVQTLSQENENLKTENKKIKDAYTAAGASFAALNQHNKRQSKANLRLMSTHAALIKSQEEKMKRYKKQVAELKEDLLMQRSVYSAELKARVQQQDVITEVIKLAKSGGLSEELLERMRAMAVDTRPSIDNGRRSSTSEYRLSSVASNVAKVSENRENRSETTTAIGSVPLSTSHSSNMSRTERRATLDTIMNESVPPPHLEGISPPGRGSLNRSSLSADESHRKSRIGGMFKKMFKKDE
uniref:Myosin motor domain-containing protein n=1 Tax=Peronospora matthiolae TaxID=2874970 RepID=A0AAV1VD06_9STRA